MLPREQLSTTTAWGLDTTVLPKLTMPRRVCRLGRVDAGETHGIASPIQPDADGVAVDHTVHLGGAGLCENWRAGQPREDREGGNVPPDATRS